MDNFDKEHYKDLKRYMKDDGVKSVSVEYAGGMFGNGVTIVYQPMTEGSDNRMVAVSVSYCSPEDTFKKKVGKYQAYLKFLRGEFIQLPLGQMLKSLDRSDFESILIEMFAPTN